MDLKVVLLEPAADVHDKLTSNLKEIFKRSGYRARITTTAAMEDVERLIEADECEVLVSDLSLNVGTSTGIGFIGLTKRRYPEVFVVACSMGDASVRVMQANYPNFDVFFPKEQVKEPTNVELAALAERFSSAFKRLSGFTIKRMGDKRKRLTASQHPLSDRELRSLLSQVLGGLAGSNAEFVPSEVRFEVLTGGFSGSLVISLEMETAHTSLKFSPCVVKVSDIAWARSEQSNFRRFAQWILPHNQRTELFGYGETARFGAVGYSFVFGGKVAFTNFTSILQDRNDSDFRQVLKAVFGKADLNFYKESAFEPTKSLSAHYREKYFGGERYDRTQSKFFESVQRLFGAKLVANSIEIGGKKYSDPFRVLFGRGSGKYTGSLCHGDLNSNNVFRSSSGEIGFIDFQDAGPGHVFDDFVSVESSIRLYWGVESDKKRRQWPFSILRAEEELARSGARKKGYGDYRDAIVPLRDLAKSVAPPAFDKEYFYAVAAVHLKLARLPGITDVQMARFIACVLTNVDNLNSV